MVCSHRQWLSPHLKTTSDELLVLAETAMVKCWRVPQPSGTDVGILWAVGMTLKSQDANSHPQHRKMGPVSGWDHRSCRSLSGWSGQGEILAGVKSAQLALCLAWPDPALPGPHPGKGFSKSTEHSTSKNPGPQGVSQVG